MALRWLVTTPVGIVGIFKTAKAAEKWLDANHTFLRSYQTKEESKQDVVFAKAETPVVIAEIEFDE